MSAVLTRTSRSSSLGQKDTDELLFRFRPVSHRISPQLIWTPYRCSADEQPTPETSFPQTLSEDILPLQRLSGKYRTYLLRGMAPKITHRRRFSQEQVCFIEERSPASFIHPNYRTNHIRNICNINLRDNSNNPCLSGEPCLRDALVLFSPPPATTLYI